MKMGSSIRIGYIDIMKGIAIICVLAGHYMSLPFVSTIIWSFHMPLFIFLNGYFFKDGPIGTRIKKSWVSYMKPYIIVWFLLLIAEVLLAFTECVNVITVAKDRLISGIWALAGNRAPFRPEWVVKIGVIWFLNALFIGTILLSFTLKIKRVFYQMLFVIVAFLIAMIQTAHGCLPFGLNYGAAFLMWLWIGYIYSIYKKRDSRIIGFIESSKGFIISMALWIGIIILEELSGHAYNICWLRLPLYGVELIGAFCGIIVVMYISRLIDIYSNYVASILRYLGKSSLWILCVHALDVELFVKISSQITIESHVVMCLRSIFDIFFALFVRRIYKSITSYKVQRI